MAGSSYDWVKNSGLKTGSGQGSILSGYGLRNPPSTGNGKTGTAQHNAIDIRYNVGTNITSTESMKYIGGNTTNPNANSGYSAVFEDSQGNRHVFMHLNSPAGYTKDQVVPAGEVLVTTGNTGNSQGPHLHYGVTSPDGKPIDPASTDSNGTAHLSKFGAEGSEEAFGGAKRSSAGPGSTEGSPAGDGGGTQAGGIGGAAKGAGGAGGGAGCVGAMMNPMNLLSVAGVLQGLGLGALNGIMGNLTGALSAIPGVSALTGAVSGITGALNSAVGGIMQGALGGITGMVSGVANNLLGSVSQIGANLIPGLGNVISGTLQSGLNQLVSPFTSILQNPLNIANAAQLFTSKGGLAGFAKEVAGNMAGQFVAGATSAFASGVTNAIGGTMNNLLGNISMASGISGLTRDVVGGITEAMGQTFGNGTGGLGSLFKNMEGIATFGVSTLANNIGMVAADMISTGSWDTRNLTRLMQPGNIAAQIIDRGLGEATGLIPAIIKNNIPLAGIDSPMYDSQVRGILSNINSTAAIAAVAKEFGVGVGLTNLGQLTDIAHMMPDSASKMPVKSFAELGLMLTEMQVTEAPDLTYIGDAFLKIETTRDLNHVSQLPKPTHQPSAELLIKSFGYGSGTFGEINMSDMLGTAAGYVHEDTFPVIIENVNWLKKQAVAAKYFNGTSFLEELIAGKYTVEGTEDGPPDPETAAPTTITVYTITVPTGRSSDTGVADGTIGTFSDYGNGEGLIEAVNAVKDYIEEGMQDLIDSTDPDVKAAIQAIDLAHNTSVAQMIREAHLLKIYNVDIFREAPMTPLDAYVFGMSLDGYGKQTGYGKAAEFLERMATDDLYGDAIKMSMRQARNAEVLAPLGVNIERFNVPNSQYYRNPLGMIDSLYNGRLPVTPVYQQTINYPKDPVEQYIIQRDATLVNNGMDLDDMLPAEKDEMYYDTYWQDANEFIRRGMGEAAMYAAISRNLKILGNRIEIIDLDGRRLPVADITANGLENLDSSTLIAVLFDLVNRVLYGNIGVTKNTNPFYTDELVYAVVEAMGAVNPGSIDFLMQSTIGQTVLPDFLMLIANRFKNINTVFDTRMDRNDPGAYGGAGPGYDPRTARGDLEN